MHGLSGISRYVTIDGIDIHYVEAGQGSSDLLYHELAASAFTRQDNITALSQHYRVFVFDLLGHGDSDNPDVDYSPGTSPISCARPSSNWASVTPQ